MTTVAPQDHIGFRIACSAIRRGVFLPKYYDPELSARLKSLRRTHDLLVLGDLISKGQVHIATGDEIGKMAYGTGSIPFVRTSDVSNWEIKTDAKQGVSEAIYSEYGLAQDVRAGDILFVKDGTYLIGKIALVMDSDLPMLYQSHILKLRVSADSPVSSFLLMACLNTPVVKRQIISKKFTADIIDTIGDRFHELVLPIPRDRKMTGRIAGEVKGLILERSRLRDRLRKIPYLAEGWIKRVDEDIPQKAIASIAEHGNPGFLRRASGIRNGVYIPKYYDPELEADVSLSAANCRMTSLGMLVKSGVLSWDTGIEVGKMAYGTGDIPFIRTSDISNWELKGDPKQLVSEDIYEANKQDVQMGDIFIVRDGTYLVGTSCILIKKDTRVLYCGGLYKLRVEKPKEIDPYLLLALLNAPIVRRQMRAKQFTRDIIDTLGKRLFEVLLPIPQDTRLRYRIAKETREVIETRTGLRDRTKEIAFEVEGLTSPSTDDLEAINS